MIVNLYYPSSRSVNDKIPLDLCSLSYHLIDDAVGYMLAMGWYNQLVKIDLKSFLAQVGRVMSMVISVYHLGFAQLQRSSLHLLMSWLGRYTIVECNI